MSSQLQSYADTFRQSEAEILRLTGSLTDEAFNGKPAPETWSIGECIEHLNRVAEAFLPRRPMPAADPMADPVEALV
jgi:hypothetical protein